ncbi:PREDICTED: protein UXT isoform X3 [Galeopterus variegatus]|uniref:Protein UXT isoform X3 n=1 Tax=Galeopterus variegatus TaxID=482537 RepID=A0ABM0R4R5_GALVR|nr:PREDICTED: protein UXT isoform X3 [Galeopterus variegatus]
MNCARGLTKVVNVVFPITTPQESIMATPPKRRAVEATGEKVLRYETFISDVLQRDLRPDTSRIYVALGYGFFLELTLAEALKFIDRKSSLLTKLSDSLTKDSMNIKAHIHMLLEGLRELQGLQNFPQMPRH